MLQETPLAARYASVNPDEFMPTRQSLLSRLKDWEDQTSWREFFETYWRLIYGVARKAGLSDAEAQDVVQETLLAVAKKMPGFTYDPAVDSFKGWLLRVTQWKIADQFRRREAFGVQASACPSEPPMQNTRKRGHQTDGPRIDTVEQVANPGTGNLQAIWDKEWQAHLLNSALARVKRRVQPQHYEMYYLHVVKEQPAREVARTLGVSAARVYLAKHRVGAVLSKELKRLAQGR